MVIRNMLANYGKLNGDRLELRPGLNIVEGSNEHGKTTWCSFVRSMLYGIDSAQRDSKRALSEKKLAQSWSGAPCSGSLVLEHGGVEYCIVRSASPTSALGRVDVTASGQKVDMRSPGEQLLGIGRDMFSRCCIIGPQTLPPGGAEIERRLTALAAGGDESVSAGEAIDRLKRWRREVSAQQKGGASGSAFLELNNIENTLSRCNEISTSLDELRNRRTSLESQRTNVTSATHPPRAARIAVSVLVAVAFFAVAVLTHTVYTALVGLPAALAVYLLSGLATHSHSPEHAPDEELLEIDRAIAKLEGSLDALNPSALVARREELVEKVETLAKRLAALEAAISLIEEADEKLRDRMSPALMRKTGEYFARMTGGRYSKTVIDRALTPYAASAVDPVLRDPRELSYGTSEQLRFALRLAICKTILPEDAPLLFDDAMVYFDDERLRSTLELLAKEAETRQIVVFTCQSRERETLKRAGISANFLRI